MNQTARHRQPPIVIRPPWNPALRNYVLVGCRICGTPDRPSIVLRVYARRGSHAHLHAAANAGAQHLRKHGIHRKDQL